MNTKTQLLNLKRWTPGKTVLLRCHIKPTEHNLRELRRMAEDSAGRVISGDDGYRATKYATAEDVIRFRFRLEHQARMMTDRVRKTLQYFEKEKNCLTPLRQRSTVESNMKSWNQTHC